VLGEVVDFAAGDGGTLQRSGEFAGGGVREEQLQAWAVGGGLLEEEDQRPELGVVGVDFLLGLLDDAAGVGGEEVGEFPEVVFAERLAEGDEAAPVLFWAEVGGSAVPLDSFVLGGEALFEPGGETVFEGEPGVLVPGFVGDDGEGLLAADVVAGEDAFLAVAAGGDLEVDGGIGAGAGAGVIFPLGAGAEDVAIEVVVGEGDDDAGVEGLDAVVGGFEDADQEVLVEGVVDGGKEAEVGGLKERAGVAGEGPGLGGEGLGGEAGEGLGILEGVGRGGLASGEGCYEQEKGETSA
jgi:hypothetical protein